jgi:excisionase family DNA binding protein
MDTTTGQAFNYYLEEKEMQMEFNPINQEIDEKIRLLTVEEAAKIANVSTSTIRNWSNDGLLPVFRCGRIMRIDQARLLMFIAQSMDKKQPAGG